MRYPRMIVVYGYRGAECIRAEFFARDETDFSTQVDTWARENGIIEWSRMEF